jgi:putative acetyltransferase
VKPETLLYEPKKGPMQLISVEYLVIAEAWHAKHAAPPVLMGQMFNNVRCCMDIQVQIPRTDRQLEAVRGLMRSFTQWHRQRHPQDIHLIDQYFDVAAFEAELASLPGKYVPPRGQLLLATSNGVAIGCVALRQIDRTTSEMKRMFVYPQFHGKGVGRALAEVIIDQARVLGYSAIRLDTSVRQNEAKLLYQRLGFQYIRPYYELPEGLRNWLVFMELKL